MKPEKVGTIKQNIMDILNLSIKPNTHIYLGDSNIRHMKNKHTQDYQLYGKYINIVLSKPDYVGINPKDNSIEYVKLFKNINSNNYVKVAVRVSTNGCYFVRSLYTLNTKRVNNYISKNKLFKV